MRRYDIEFSLLDTKQIRKLSSKLKAFEKDLDKLNVAYLKSCCYYLARIANRKLLIDDTFSPSEMSDIRENITIEEAPSKSANYRTYEVKWCSDIIGWVEFGTGQVGARDPHPLADKLGYHYASGNVVSKKGKWTFRIPEEYMEVINQSYADEDLYYKAMHDAPSQYMIDFEGYTGKKIIYQSFRDFVNDKIYVEIYEMLFDKLMAKHFG